MLVCGGKNNTEEENKWWTYRPESNQWGEVGPLNQGDIARPVSHWSRSIKTVLSLVG